MASIAAPRRTQDGKATEKTAPAGESTLEDFIRRWFGPSGTRRQQASDRAGDVAVVMMRLAKPVPPGEQQVVQFGRVGGDASFQVVEGERFVVDRSELERAVRGGRASRCEARPAVARRRSRSAREPALGVVGHVFRRRRRCSWCSAFITSSRCRSRRRMSRPRRRQRPASDCRVPRAVCRFLPQAADRGHPGVSVAVSLSRSAARQAGDAVPARFARGGRAWRSRPAKSALSTARSA